MRKSEGVLLDGGCGPRWQGSVMCGRAACHAGPSPLVPYRFLLSGFRLVIPHRTPPHRGNHRPILAGRPQVSLLADGTHVHKHGDTPV